MYIHQWCTLSPIHRYCLAVVIVVDVVAEMVNEIKYSLRCSIYLDHDILISHKLKYTLYSKTVVFTESMKTVALKYQ